jgi:hypothetical protein
MMQPPSRQSCRPIIVKRILGIVAMVSMIVAAPSFALADACPNEADFSKTGELFNPQEGQWVTGGTVWVDGYWDNPSKVLHVEVLDGATGSNQVMEVDTTSAATATVFNCTPAGSTCPVNANRYAFGLSLPIGVLGPGSYRIRVHREGTPCNFAKPISVSCYNSCLPGSNFCDCTAGGKDGTCGTGYRNVLVNQ